MPIVSCRICSKKFYAKPFWIKRGFGKYCSSHCQYEGRKKGGKMKCFICQEIVYRAVGQLKKSKSKKYFCSKSCQTKWRNSEFIGPKHANWKNGNSAYKSILKRNKIKQICGFCKLQDVRMLAVHHIDKNHKNNVLSNLTWLCHNCHFLVHHYEQENSRFLLNRQKLLNLQ